VGRQRRPQPPHCGMMSVCVYARGCMFVCTCGCMSPDTFPYVLVVWADSTVHNLPIAVWCLYVCMHVWLYVCMHVWLYVSRRLPLCAGGVG
jgi:hypothetical protein